MNEKDKQEYLENYKKSKEKGVYFFPDILFKDALVALIIFIILIGLSLFIGIAVEDRADPSDSNYTPRPEWYFLFLFQLLKYFPGELEVVGVVVIPTLIILLLLFLPFLDRGPKRHFMNRKIVSITTLVLSIGVIFLTVQSIREIPPPVEAAAGDQTAALYTVNCAPCHGPNVPVSPGTNLHAVIAQGSHDGMPSWSSELSTDQIDALVGFILSPGGSSLFTESCSACHQVDSLIESDPLELKKSLEQGLEYPSHADLSVSEYFGDIPKEDQTTLINFLIAPDGRRLFNTYCASCHGQSIAFVGGEAELKTIISEGGLHLEMPSWQGTLSSSQITDLANYVVNPQQYPDSASLFEQYCSSCHGDRIPQGDSVEAAQEIIASGGSHQTMPIWGEVLTEEQVDALIEYTLSTAEGSSFEIGQDLYSQNCTVCHGEFGEGGINPANPNDIIFPISTGEYLKTRDDFTLSSIIAQGQPNFGMSPFGATYGGPMDDDQITAVVDYIRAWEANPPVELPPDVSPDALALSGSEIYASVCAQCHGVNGEGGVGPSFIDPGFHQENTDEDIFNSISQGHPGTSMIAWAGILSNDQIQALIDYINQFESEEVDNDKEVEAQEVDTPTFIVDVLPIFEENCKACHGSMGGWDGTSYEAVMTSGINAPTVIPGDPENSLLVQKMAGTHSQGNIMPPGGKLADEIVQIIIDWVKAGAKE